MVRPISRKFSVQRPGSGDGFFWTTQRVVMFGMACFGAGYWCGCGGSSDDYFSMTSPFVTSLPSFTDVLISSESDKYFNHHYENYYTDWLEPYRTKTDMKMLEIGVDFGLSMELWKNYFPNAEKLIGLAYYDHPVIEYVDRDTNELVRKVEEMDLKEVQRQHADSRAQVIPGDQNRVETMESVCHRGPYDVIIDDGSHLPSHVVFSLFSLWNHCVKDGGVYIIEDLETSYWNDGNQVYGYRLNGTGFGALPQHSVPSKLKQFVDVLIKDKTDFPNGFLSVMPGDGSLCKVEFGKNIAALHKCNTYQQKNRPVYKYFGQDFNHTRIFEWVEDAKKSNPKGFYKKKAPR